jgi:hypothetical protein
VSLPPPPPPGDQPRFPEFPPRRPIGESSIYPAVMPATGTNGLAIASMVLGIVGVVLCCLWIPSILAVVFGVIAINQIKANPTQAGRGMAVAGLVLGMVGVVLVVSLFAFGNVDYTWNT